MGHGGEFWQNVVHWRREWQKTSVFLPWEPHEQYEKGKRYDTERWTPQVSRCPNMLLEITGETTPERIEREQKQNQHPVVDVTNDRSKVWCCNEQYCIGTWNVRCMNQGKLKIVRQEMARVNINILGISELKWTWMGEFNSDIRYIYYSGQESLRRNGVALIVNKRVRNAVVGCKLKNYRMISIRFQGKTFHIMVI